MYGENVSSHDNDSNLSKDLRTAR